VGGGAVKIRSKQPIVPHGHNFFIAGRPEVRSRADEKVKPCMQKRPSTVSNHVIENEAERLGNDIVDFLHLICFHICQRHSVWHLNEGERPDGDGGRPDPLAANNPEVFVDAVCATEVQ
jgi:hypothetical protein